MQVASEERFETSRTVTKERTMKLSGWSGLVAVAAMACVAPQAPKGIGDINMAVQRYWNTEVIIEGQVVKADADPIGTTRGVFQLVDDTDRNPIRVETKELPAVGSMVRVRGVVQQDPQNVRYPLVREIERGRAGSRFFLYLMIGSGLVALILVGILIYTLLHRPPPGPEPVVGRSGGGYPGPDPSDSDATVEYHRPRSAPVDDVTMTFEYWGYRFTVTEGPDQGKSVPIGTTPFFIGRAGSRQNHLELSDRTVSRTQATIRRHPKTHEFTLEAQGGTNETLVDGKPVQVATISEGTRIRVGATVIQFQRDQG